MEVGEEEEEEAGEGVEEEEEEAGEGVEEEEGEEGEVGEVLQRLLQPVQDPLEMQLLLLLQQAARQQAPPHHPHTAPHRGGTPPLHCCHCRCCAGCC